MGTPIRKIIDRMPAERQARIRAKADVYIREYASLAALRKDLGITQEDIARHQGIKQVNISNLEKRHDMLISTLQRYVEALGGELEIRIRIPPDGMIRMKGLGESGT